MSNIAFIDLAAQRARIADQVRGRIDAVLEHGRYIMGPEVKELEAALCDFTGAQHCVSCSSGTDALLMALMGLDVGPGDAVFVPTFTFVSTAEVVALLGATPIFIDVQADTYNMDVESLQAGIERARARGLRPAAVIPVDLFGQPADYPAIQAVAEPLGMPIIGDAAQSLGASLSGAQVGTLAKVTTTSFFPAKPLGCYGDGGAIFTDDEELAAKLRSVRVHGQGQDKYDNVRVGINGRVDTMQAAILLEKLKIFPDEIVARDTVADRYTQALKDAYVAPVLLAGARSVWAQYTLQTQNRDAVLQKLKDHGIPTAVYYPIPLHQQTGYRDFDKDVSLPVSEGLSHKVFSIPMHPYLDQETQDRIIAALLEVAASV